MAVEPFPIRDAAGGILNETIRLSFESLRSRFVRVTAVSIGTCPEGHAGAGEKAWLFADEIAVR
jgi:hypothetical protein